VTVRLRGLLVLPLIATLALLLAPSASADAYTDEVAGKFNAQTHVVADPAANPPLQNPTQVNEQILSSRWTWSSVPPVYVAAVAPAQSGVTTPDAIHNAILGLNPEFRGVILVIDAKGYHVRAYNVPRAVADNVDPFMAQAAKHHRADPYGATTEFISKLADVGVASGGSVTTSPVANHTHSNWTWLWVLLALFGFVAVGLGLIWFTGSRSRKRRNLAAVSQQLIAAGSDVSDLDNAVLTNSDVDVSAESLKANSSLYDARKAFEAGDYATARTHLRIVQSTVAKANRKLNPGAYPPEPDVEAVTSVPDADRKQAQVRAKSPDGQYVTINNNNYSTAPQPGYPNYYGGGYHNGVFFYPGYYPYAFWGPGWGWSLGDVLLMDALLDDHWGGSYGGGYESGFEAGRDSAFSDTYTSDQNAGYDSQQADVGFGGNDFSGGSDSGGGNFDFGGSDSGGGNFDFGGSDFGGGGSDSGSGDFGF
jgi:uncharacterized membrane protein YgcG